MSWLVGDFWSAFPGNQMPVQPGRSSDEEDGVGVWFILCQLMFTGLLSIPVITRSLHVCWMLMCAVHMSFMTASRESDQSRKGLMKVALREIVQVDAFIIIGYCCDGDELCVCWASQWINKEEPCGWLWNRFAQEQEVWANTALLQNEKTVI